MVDQPGGTWNDQLDWSLYRARNDYDQAAGHDHSDKPGKQHNIRFGNGNVDAADCGERHPCNRKLVRESDAAVFGHRDGYHEYGSQLVDQPGGNRRHLKYRTLYGTGNDRSAKNSDDYGDEPSRYDEIGFCNSNLDSASVSQPDAGDRDVVRESNTAVFGDCYEHQQYRGNVVDQPGGNRSRQQCWAVYGADECFDNADGDDHGDQPGGHNEIGIGKSNFDAACDSEPHARHYNAICEPDAAVFCNRH